jgi:hypothetical protein
MRNARQRDEERRSNPRYPIRVEVEYRVTSRTTEAGTGQTVNISSGGLLLETEVPLSVGVPIELSLSWPALLEDDVPLQLRVFGETIWARERETAVRIWRYDFRLRGVSTLRRKPDPPALSADSQ